MDWDFLLEKDDLRKYQLLVYLDRTPNQLVESAKLQDELKYSNYVFKTVVSGIIEDIDTFGLADDFNIQVTENSITLYEMSNINTSIFLKYYLRQSVQVEIIEKMLFENAFSINEFAEDNFTSYTYVYQRINRLKTELQKFDVVITKKGSLEGNEFFLRMLLMNLFIIMYDTNEFYHLQFEGHVEKLIDICETYSERVITESLRMKLYNFFHVTLIRSDYDHIVSFGTVSSKIQQDILTSNQLFANEIAGFIKETTRLTEEQVNQEICFILSYMYDEFLLLSADKFLPSDVTEIAGIFLKSFETEFSFEISAPLKNEMVDILTNLAYDILLFPFKSLFFINDIEVSFFQGSYPEYFDFCYRFVNQLITDNSKGQQKKYFFYFSLIMLIQKVPVNNVTDPIEVCIDFSYGEGYNRLIKRDLLYFSSLNIEVVSNVGIKTKMIITDLVNLYTNNPVKKTLWFAPPRAIDWEELIDELIQIRKDSVEVKD